MSSAPRASAPTAADVEAWLTELGLESESDSVAAAVGGKEVP